MNTIEPIRSLLEKGIFEGVFSGAQVAVCTPNGRSEVVCAGTTRFNGGVEVTKSVVFDLASLTKLFVAATILRLVDDAWFNLDASLGDIFPEKLCEGHLADVTISQMLAHEAGLKAWVPFFERVDLMLRATPFGREAIIGMAMAEPPEIFPGKKTIYSDLGYIILGALLPDVTGENLDVIIERQVLAPLKLGSISFRPHDASIFKTKNFLSSVAATEDCPWRKRVLAGEVHDDNAWTMGGVAGHAGLFGGADDVARFGAAWLESIESGGWLSAQTASQAVSCRALGRGLGWDMVTVGTSSAGDLISDRSFGHLGFTGCSLWVDPDADVAIALLTNRVHPSRENKAIRAFRPLFHNEIMKLI